ncbi:TetR/AcrR family transcriptional regulator [Chthonobacter rhizosphaerae]|uniref:TetR/AcrR family transcriptional regulator n=1 Tax=Chthonobacter rhizosphaerae TaxID=2735553 RepID=UPI0015EE9D0B|nr:TetR/AcrR family transcriptional regulator [Chthonobacter rhizosphaerae]
MSDVTDRRERLREKLVEVAEAAIAEGGLAAVKARPLAEAAGCAVGAIYNVFPDLDGLILAVNVRTLEALDQAMTEVGGRFPDDPERHLQALGAAYLGFAAAQTRRWRALFEHRLPEGYAVPDWYTDRLDTIFRHLRDPFAALFPDRPASERIEMARALFAGAHGIVALGLDGKLGAVDAPVIAARIRFLVRAVLAGA